MSLSLSNLANEARPVKVFAVSVKIDDKNPRFVITIDNGTAHYSTDRAAWVYNTCECEVNLAQARALVDIAFATHGRTIRPNNKMHRFIAPITLANLGGGHDLTDELFADAFAQAEVVAC